MAVDIFLKIPTPAVKGEVTAKGHEDSIQIDSFTFGVQQTGHGSRGGGLGAGKAEFQDMNLVKLVDNSTPTLMQLCATGKHIPTATMTVRKAGDGQLDYYIVVMSDVLITSVTNSGQFDGDLPHENVAINFSKIDFTYKKQDKTGALGGPVQFVYDLKLSSKV